MAKKVRMSKLIMGERYDPAQEKRVYAEALRLANPKELRAAFEEVKNGGGYTWEEILKDADAKKAEVLLRRKAKSKKSSSRLKSRSTPHAAPDCVERSRTASRR